MPDLLFMIRRTGFDRSDIIIYAEHIVRPMESPVKAVKDLVVGTVVGITSMLPGISGATMMVAFGIYERFIRDLADLRTYLRKDIRFILLLAAGVVIGTVLCAKVLGGFLDTYPVLALMFFAGLIIGQLIPLFRNVKAERGENGYTPDNLAAFAVGLAVMAVMIVFEMIGAAHEVSVGHDAAGILMMFLVGMIVAVSALLPGLSHSTILLVFGLMTAFLDAVSNFDLLHLGALGVGAVVAVLVFAKIIHRALEEHHLTTLLFILGLTAGSVMVIFYNAATNVQSVIDVAGGAIAAVAGFVVSYYCAKLDSEAGEE